MRNLSTHLSALFFKLVLNNKQLRDRDRVRLTHNSPRSEKCGLGVSPLGFVPWSGDPTGQTPQVEHLFKRGGLCITSRAYPSAKADATRTGTLLRRQTLREREQSLANREVLANKVDLGMKKIVDLVLQESQ